MTLNNEIAKLAAEDAEKLSNLADWIYAYGIEIERKRSGDVELKKIKDRIPEALRILLNYL
jgi:hypothetical protein